MGRTASGLDETERLLGEQQDFFPLLEVFPELSDSEVERFAELGRQGVERQRAGELDGAEAAFRAQAAIYAPNPEPFVSLAQLAASRRANEEALEHARAAVERGFHDLDALARSEVWSRLKNHPKFVLLIDSLPRLREAEEAFAGWEAFYTDRPPESAAVVVRRRGLRSAELARMAPALGVRPTARWTRLIDRASAAALEAYVLARPEAQDLALALDALEDIYAGGTILRWARLSSDVARRTERVVSLSLERSPQGDRRAGTLVLRALALNARRDERGAFLPGTIEGIRTALDEVLERHADAPFAAVAAEGRVRIEFDARQPARAAAVYRSFVARNAARPTLLAAVRDALGLLALEAGGLPEFRGPTLDGTIVDRDALRGRIVVLDFWATWCAPCVEGLSTMRRIAERHGEDVLLLSVNLDHADEMSREQLARWVAEHRLPGIQLHDGQGWESDLVRTFGVREIPFTAVFTSHGDLVVAGAQGKRLERAIELARR